MSLHWSGELTELSNSASQRFLICRIKQRHNIILWRYICVHVFHQVDQIICQIFTQEIESNKTNWHSKTNIRYQKGLLSRKRFAAVLNRIRCILDLVFQRSLSVHGGGGSLQKGVPWKGGVLWRGFYGMLSYLFWYLEWLCQISDSPKSWTLNQSRTTISQGFQLVLFIYIRNLWCVVTGATN